MERQGRSRRAFLVKSLGTGAGAWLALELQPLQAVERHDAGLLLPPGRCGLLPG